MTMIVRALGLLVAFAWAAPTPASQAAATAPTRYVELRGERVAYRSFGSGSPLLLLNRMRGTLDTWDPLFLDELAKSNRVITVDYPGVGYSSGSLPEEIGLASDFAVTFADALGIERFAILGWSWGGTVAQTLLVEHPRRVTHVVLIGTVPPGKGGVAVQPAFLERAFKPVNDLADEIVLFFEPDSEASRAAAKASHDRIHARPGVADRIPAKPEVIQAYLKAAANYREDAPRRLDRLMVSRTPILILSGDNDISTAVENWFALKGRIPTAQLVVYPRSGHAPQHQYPELAAAQIALFQRLTAPGGAP